jgi:N-acyl-L-homoserine lactone synthetase
MGPTDTRVVGATVDSTSRSSDKPVKKRGSAAWEFVEEPKVTHGPYRIYRAVYPVDFAAVDELWNDVYGRELGWLSPDAELIHRDRYHPHSTYLMAMAEGEVVGTMRLVSDSPVALPIEQFVSISDLREPDRRLIECQRLMIRDRYRNKRWPEFPFGVFAALAKACIHWCVLNGQTHIIADVFSGTQTTPIAPLLALGFEETGKEFVDTELDEPDKSLALLLPVAELFSRPFRTRSPFYRYLMEYDELLDIYG